MIDRRTQVAVVAVVVVILAPTASARVQEPSGPDPAFEVASLKPNTSGNPQLNMLEVLPGGRFRATNTPLSDLIQLAYGVSGYQLDGGPAWIRSERFDIDAKAVGELKPGAAPRPQLRRLLEDRFKLKVHRETKELPIFALVVARLDRSLGPSIRRSPRDNCAQPTDHAPQVPVPATSARRCWFRMIGGTLTAASMPVRALAGRLTSIVNRFVVDRTGLEGVFDYELKWAADQLSSTDPGAISIFTALREQLGLKLDSDRGPVDALVIDSIDRPTPD